MKIPPFHTHVITLPTPAEQGQESALRSFFCEGSEQRPRMEQERENRSPGFWLPATETGTGMKGQGRLLSAKATRGSSNVGGSGTEGI